MQACFDQDADLVLSIFFKIAPIHTYARFQERAPGVETDPGRDVVPHVVRVAHHVILVTSLDPHFAADIADVGQMGRDAMWEVIKDSYRIFI